MEFVRKLFNGAERLFGFVIASITGKNVANANENVEATMEKDANGNGLLRVVLGAVFGFDVPNDLWKTSLSRRESVTIQTHNAVSVTTGSTNDGAIQTASGYSEVAIGAKSDTTSAFDIIILWFADSAGTNYVGAETVATIAAGSDTGRSGRTTLKGPYFKVRLKNNDASTRTMSSWTTLIP